MTLLEPDVALTDFGLTIECLALAAWLHWRTPMNPMRTWFVIFFAALGIAALLGGITHGFLDDPRSTLYGLTWSATLLAIGIAGRLVLMWWLAKTFESQLLDFLDFLQRYQWWAIGVSILLVVLVNMRNMRRGRNA